MTNLTRTRVQDPAAVPSPGDAPTPVRRRRPVLVVAAVLLLLLAGLTFASALQRAGATTLVWSLGTDVARGEPVTAAQLQAVEVPADATATLLRTDAVSVEGLAGQVWAADLVAGQLLSAALLVDTLDVPIGSALVGVALERGSLPANGVAAGDRVLVIDTRSEVDAGGRLLVDRATVEAVAAPVDDFDSAVVVTLLVPEELAPLVAAAAADVAVALVVVP